MKDLIFMQFLIKNNEFQCKQTYSLYITLYIKSLMNESLSKPLNESIKQSVDPNSKNIPASRVSLNEEVMTQSVLTVNTEQNNKLLKRYKIVTGFGVCCMFVGLIFFLLLPPLIHNAIVQGAIDQAVLGPDNQNFWAHFPGQSQTIITRNYSFFNLTNPQEFFIHGQKPRFRQSFGYILTQMQDFLNITYNEDMSKVKFIDWLHFQQNPDTRVLDQKFELLNVPSLGYWYILKNSRDPVVFIEGFSLLFTNIEQSIIDTVLGQGVKSQYLPDFQTAYLQLFQPTGITYENAKFLWNDQAFGFSDKNNLKYWVQAAQQSFNQKQTSFSEQALDLKDYFTLTDGQIFFILTQINQYVDSLKGLILDNHYCTDIATCDGRQLAIRQIAESYVTFKTPPVSSITPTDTICTDNQTCNGYYPQLSAYYKNVYLIEHESATPFLTFDIEMVRKWLDYNPSRKQGEYNKNQSALLHIGNLDALFGNGTRHDQTKKNHFDTTPFLKNIQGRFELQSEEHTRVFWEWIKYLMAGLLRQWTSGNQKLGIANAFSGGLYNSFSFLQDNLQNHMLTTMLKNQLSSKNCDNLMAASLQTTVGDKLVSNICNNYSHNIQSTQFVRDSIQVCRNKYRHAWLKFRQMGASLLQLQSYCDKTVQGGFGQLYHKMRVELKDFYNCDETPNQYCSDYELALKQWANSTVTLNHPNSAGNTLNKTTTFSQWNSSASPIQLSHYSKKCPQKKLPTFSTADLYKLFNFDNFFSAPVCLKSFKDQKTSQGWKDYMRYVVVFIGLRGLTHVRSAREYIFGYNDEYLLWRKNNYPPFGGDPSTPAYTAFNDLNITKEQANLELEWWTGKSNSSMTGQYYTINGYRYLTTNYTRFNGNQTYWVLESPWAENDYFYGTNGKSFAPDQPNSKNISIYVPNLQRYGSGSLNQSYPYERYGYDLDIAYLGHYIYQTGETWPENKKYYQNYFAVFNQTSVLGFPFFMTKHHFMNCSSNWSSYIHVFNEDGSFQFTEANHWDDSYVIVEPYSGVSFQSTIYLQANYMHEPDDLFTYNQTCMLPVFSIYRSGNLTQQKANSLFKPLTTAISVKTAIFYIGIVLAILGLGGFAYGFTNYRRIKRRGQDSEEKKSIKISMQPTKKKGKKSKVKKSEQNPLMREDEEQLESDSRKSLNDRESESESKKQAMNQQPNQSGPRSEVQSIGL